IREFAGFSRIHVIAEENSQEYSSLTFICVDGTVMPLANVCDGIPHCPDSSDEVGTLCRHVVCPTYMYRCNYGACVSRTARCNGLVDCMDASDEVACDRGANDICSDKDFQCSTIYQECIPFAEVCNGYKDCSDGSDENAKTCQEYICPEHTFRCSYGGCVHQEVVCDSVKDCVDGTDEDSRTCAAVNCEGYECSQHECRDQEFACENRRQCLPMTKVCDGTRHCADASDESAKLCEARECPENWFRCAYGGCIRPELKCNSRLNCYDWSDEDESLCGITLPEGACRLPAAKAGIHYSVSGCSRCRPGEVVPELTRLDYVCDVKGSLQGASEIYCQNNRWFPSVPSCAFKNETEGVTCPAPSEAHDAIRRCEAMWGPHKGWLPCDRALPVAAALIVKGWSVEKEETLPWQATLFSHEDGQWTFFCGGTLIAERVVLTAGHCVWKTAADTIRVAFGILSSDLNQIGENAQVIDVESIELQNAYQDHESNYGSDIALLILKKAVTITTVVGPVCIPWDSNAILLEYQRNSGLGLVAGMGLTENDTFSSVLRVTTVKIISDDECRKNQNRDFRKYLTYTSFCAGWANGTGVCNGDSGGGLVLQRPNSSVWEIHGVVSVSPRKLGTNICDPNFYAVFTKAFQVKTLKSGIQVSPGLSITTYVTYTFKRMSISHAIIPIEINGKIFDYYVISTLATEYISIEPKSVDFGTIDIGYSSGLKIVTIRNEGNKSTRIKSTPNIRVPIKVHVIVPKLVVYHPNTTGDFTLIDFPPTIENTCRYDTFVLRNLSSRASSFVVLGEIDNEVKCIPDIDPKQHPTYNIFEIHPFEGRIDPFQGIIFEVKFSPINIISQRRKEQEQKHWRKCENKYPNQMTRDFMQFIRIVRVHCIESENITKSMMEISSVLVPYTSSTDAEIYDVVKLCLYGEVEAIQLHFEPDILYFGDLIVGQISQRVLRLTNPSVIAPIYLECTPNAAVRCYPKWMKLMPKTSIEVLVKICGKESIEPSFKLFFNVAADSYDLTASRRCFGKMKVGSYFVVCTVNIIFKSKKGLLSDSMILQPGSTMTKLVEYFADEVGKFNGYINYVINHNHSFELNITACIVRKQLYIDKREIELGKEWSRAEVYQPVTSIVRIINKLNAKIRFRWEVPVMSGFYIEPKSGSVRGNATLHAYVYYEYDNMKDNYTQAIMTCESGSRVSLRLSAPRFVPKVEFVNDHVNLGEIALNFSTKVIAVLQNFEFNEVTYEIDSASLIRGCNVNPLRGKISPRGIAILEVNLTFDVCCRFTTVIAVTIQGCLQLLYRINGNVSFPRLKLVPQRIDIKRLSIDALQTHQITATNVGTTLLKLQILLEEYPEFRVSLLVNNKSLEIGTEGITIAPGTSQNLYLHFQPIDLASCAFYLPIVINELLGPISMLNPKSIRPAEFLKSHEAHYMHLSSFAMTTLPDKLPTVSIDYTVAGRVIFFSKLLFRFNALTNEINSIWQTLVNDRIVVQWTAQGECICSNQRSGVRDTCPFNVSIPIPSCNVQLRSCVIEMFKKTLDSRERLFWSKYSNTYIELRLIKWLMGRDTDSAALEFVHIFNTAVTYKVTISDKSNSLILPECFTIQGK
ncbi:PREDICTED: uncharacterized protein LOC108774285, partial [Cyphomyrmex costatus]|uniref:uncharacterized protein LOC108774285 n=1 Tax=Cyphomyrmex costatus TaxID=456900 RepID=UPI0008522382